MAQRKSNLGHLTREREAKRRVIAIQSREERASANEQTRQDMARIRAEERSERRAARLDTARLRARRWRLHITNVRFLFSSFSIQQD